MAHQFKDIKVWKRSMELTIEVYKMTSRLPDSEKFGLSAQIQRSAVSVASNIAEGSGRNSNKEFSRFLDIALASSFELETQLILATSIYEEETKLLMDKLDEVQKMIVGFKKSLVF